VSRVLRLLAANARMLLLQWMGWRGMLLWLTVNQLVTPLLGLAVWSAALPGRSAVTDYYVALLVVQMLTVSYEYHTFSNAIYDGGIAGGLLRPQPVVLRPLAENLALRAWHLIFALPLIVVTAALVHASLELGWVLLALPSLCLAGALRFLFTYLTALAAFWTQRAAGVVTVGETLIFLAGGAAAPIALYPAPVRGLVELLPFPAMLGVPAEIAAGGIDTGQVVVAYLLQAGWIAALALCVVIAWRAGVERYTAVGG
jgi:ABC-2 type transport system permease protein